MAILTLFLNSSFNDSARETVVADRLFFFLAINLYVVKQTSPKVAIADTAFTSIAKVMESPMEVHLLMEFARFLGAHVVAYR